MGIIGSWEGYTTSPLYLFNNGWTNNLQTKGMSITANSSGGYFVESAINSSVTSLRFTCRAFNGALCMARLNQAVNLTNYNYIRVKGKTLNCFRMGVGISTSTSISSVDNLVSKNYSTTAYDSLTELSPLLNISNITGNYYIYLYITGHSSRDGGGGVGNSFSQIWLTTV